MSNSWLSLIEKGKLAKIPCRPTVTKRVSVPLKDPESIIVKTSYNFSTFYLSIHMSSLYSLLHEPPVVGSKWVLGCGWPRALRLGQWRERLTNKSRKKPQTAEDLVHCVPNGCVTGNWSKCAMLLKWPQRAARSERSSLFTGDAIIDVFIEPENATRVCNIVNKVTTLAKAWILKWIMAFFYDFC